MSNRLILIAEDDADDRYLLQTAFSEKGYPEKIEFVENGVALLAWLETGTLPAIILLDLNMPKKDGREVLKELKQHPAFRSIPVIIFTTTKNELEIKRCYEMGANSYIVKPISYESLLTVVESLHTYWVHTASTPAS